MPVMDGWEATRRLKGNPQTRDIPVIAFSADAAGRPARKGARRGLQRVRYQADPVAEPGWSRPFGEFSLFGKTLGRASIEIPQRSSLLRC